MKQSETQKQTEKAKKAEEKTMSKPDTKKQTETPGWVGFFSRTPEEAKERSLG